MAFIVAFDQNTVYVSKHDHTAVTWPLYTFSDVENRFHETLQNIDAGEIRILLISPCQIICLPRIQEEIIEESKEIPKRYSSSLSLPFGIFARSAGLVANFVS